MVDITIDDLIDGRNIRNSAALNIFNQGGVSFKGSTRPNPDNQINVISKEQLVAELGSDLFIPAGESVIISIDASFELDIPFKKQADSSLLIKSQSITKSITYTGSGSLIRMDGPVIGAITQLQNIVLKGNFSNQCLDIHDSLLFLTDTVQMAQFDNVGVLRGMTVLWNKTGLIGNSSGLAFIDTPVANIDVMGSESFIGLGPAHTLMSFIGSSRMDLVFETNQHVTDGPFEFVFIDPNSSLESSFKVRDSGIISTVPNSLFQQGTDVAVISVADNGSGKLQCTTAGHDLVNDMYAVLSGFGESSYNVTSRITRLDSMLFVAEDIDFVPGVDSGNVNQTSLDETDPRVIGRDNPNQKDSFWLVECRSQEIISFVTVAAVPIPLQKTIPSGGDFIQDIATERYTVDGFTGVITYIGAEPITGTVSFEFNISKVGGGTDSSVIFLRQNTSDIVKTIQAVSLTSTPQKITYGGGLVKIIPGNTFQLFLDNAAASTINVDGLKVLITRQ